MKLTLYFLISLFFTFSAFAGESLALEKSMTCTVGEKSFSTNELHTNSFGESELRINEVVTDIGTLSASMTQGSSYFFVDFKTNDLLELEFSTHVGLARGEEGFVLAPGSVRLGSNLNGLIWISCSFSY